MMFAIQTAFRVTDETRTMHAFRNIVLSAAIAGLVVGLIITLVQQVGTAPLILRSEVYERAAEVGPSQPALAGAVHDQAGSADLRALGSNLGTC